MNTGTIKQIKKVAIYNRKSRPDETDDGLKKNLAFLIDKCTQYDWDYEVFQEVGSSQDINRPELQKMLDKVQGFHYDAVVVTDQDRLSRTTAGFSQIKEILTNYGVQVVTSSKIYNYETQEDDLMSDMQSIVAKQEYLNIKKRLVRGKRQSAKEGNWVGGQTPYGYSYDHKTKKLVPNDDAPIVKRMYEKYLSGKTSTDIERELELEGVLTPTGTTFKKARISVILANPVYKGTVIYGKTKVSKTSKKPSGSPRQDKTDKDAQISIDNAHEPIVSPEEWDKVEAIRKGRNSKPPSARIGKVAFTGLIRCSLCGRTHSFQRRKGKELRITSCQTRNWIDDENYKICENKGVRLENFEQAFYFQFQDYVKALELYLDEVKNNIKPDTSNPADEKAHLESQIKRIDAQIKKTQQGFIMEIFTEDEAQAQIKQLKAQKEHIEAELERINTKTEDESIDELEATVNKLRDILSGDTELETKDINALLSKQIDYIEYKRVGDHKAEMEIKIHYKGQTEEQEDEQVS
ncbi:recombinase family protein [Paraliobacillus ryukyuensis]|uniref:recombinase family protein n=1 Tax=Paraliobacillus ryukyuensis TaxID=200904 RepID=UPI0009A5E1FB|nr:recombinase family protein [Paraliobacillus ryukyuensis]